MDGGVAFLLKWEGRGVTKNPPSTLANSSVQKRGCPVLAGVIRFYAARSLTFVTAVRMLHSLLRVTLIQILIEHSSQEKIPHRALTAFQAET